jgi:type II secretory pathway pseudopilin PulG
MERADQPWGAPGVTLAELTIVIVVVSITALVFAGLFREAVRSYELVDREKALLQGARYAMERITHDLRRVPGPDRIEEAGPTSVTLLDPDSSRVGYSWNGVKGSDLLCTRNGIPRVLATQVDSLAFSYYTSDGSRLLGGRSKTPSGLTRIAVYLRLSEDGQSVELVGGAFLRSRA